MRHRRITGINTGINHCRGRDTSNKFIPADCSTLVSPSTGGIKKKIVYEEEKESDDEDDPGTEQLR